MAYGTYGSSYTSAFSVADRSVPTASEPSAVERVKRHPKYYLQGGDVHFLVENYLFRVHRYFFERESAVFREKLGVPAAAGQTPKGSSDANPYSLDDVQANDFSRFLWVFYNPKYSIYDATVDDWSAILKLAFDWRFAEVKKLACRELEKFEIDPVQKVALYQTYEIDRKLLIPSYMLLTLRPEPLNVREGRQLGLETALLLASARECARSKPSENGVHSPAAANVDEDHMVSIIREVFGLMPGPPSPSLTPVEPITGVSAFATTPATPARVTPASPSRPTIPIHASTPVWASASRPASPTTQRSAYNNFSAMGPSGPALVNPPLTPSVPTPAPAAEKKPANETAPTTSAAGGETTTTTGQSVTQHPPLRQLEIPERPQTPASRRKNPKTTAVEPPAEPTPIQQTPKKKGKEQKPQQKGKRLQKGPERLKGEGEGGEQEGAAGTTTSSGVEVSEISVNTRDGFDSHAEQQLSNNVTKLADDAGTVSQATETNVVANTTTGPGAGENSQEYAEKKSGGEAAEPKPVPAGSATGHEDAGGKGESDEGKVSSAVMGADAQPIVGRAGGESIDLLGLGEADPQAATGVDQEKKPEATQGEESLLD